LSGTGVTSEDEESEVEEDEDEDTLLLLLPPDDEEDNGGPKEDEVPHNAIGAGNTIVNKAACAGWCTLGVDGGMGCNEV